MGLVLLALLGCVVEPHLPLKPSAGARTTFGLVASKGYESADVRLLEKNFTKQEKEEVRRFCQGTWTGCGNRVVADHLDDFLAKVQLEGRR